MATNTYVALQSTTVTGSPVSSVTFDLTTISGYTDLVVVINGTTTDASTSNLCIQFNGDTSSTNYSATRILGDGSSASSGILSNQAYVMIGDVNNARFSSIVNIQNYSNNTTYKTVLARTGNASAYLGAYVGLWRNTAPITSVIFSRAATTFTVGTTFSLYGIRAQAVPTAKATGGTITYAADGYTYHAFTSSGTFTPNQALSCDALVVAGGGSGGRSYGGGGGAGGLLGFTAQAFSATGYAVTVGAGGAAQTADTFRGNNGNDSQIAGLTLVKGGGGGGYDAGGGTGATGNTGGSGGGGSRTYAGGAATSDQGNRGGNISSGNAGAGGGGAGAQGTDGSGSATTGGVGSSAYSQWGLATTTGQNSSGTVYYAGGGGGQSAAGGLGGGGQNVSGLPSYNSSGTINTGGGAGADSTVGSGGSGIVIIRYAS